MFIKISQTNTAGKNKFELKDVDNNIEYLAGTPWMDIDIPHKIDNVRPCILTDANENVIFSTGYNIGENILNSDIPFKWLLTGKEKSSIYRVYDASSKEVARFYSHTTKHFYHKYVIEYNGEYLSCYDKSVGKTRRLMIYRDETQIAEIVKPIDMVDYMDKYYLYLLDEYKQFKDILSFFVIYFDYNQYSNSGKMGKVAYIGWHYTADGYNKYYNKNWITDHFDSKYIEDMNKKMQEIKALAKARILKTVKFTSIFFGVGAIILLILAIYLFTR